MVLAVLQAWAPRYCAYKLSPWRLHHLCVGLPASAVQPTVKNLINGKFTESKTKKWIEVRNPVCASPPSARASFVACSQP